MTFSIPSVHEDTTAVRYDIEDIHDVTLTTPTEQVVFETHQNGKSITSFHYDNMMIR